MNYEIEYAWAAGFLDGEGHFGIHPNGHQNGKKYLRAQIAAKQKFCDEPLEKLVDLFGGAIYHPPSGVAVWQIQSTIDLLHCITCILPYLTVKRDVALIVKEFCEYIESQKKGWHTPLTDEGLQRREEFRQRTKEANHRFDPRVNKEANIRRLSKENESSVDSPQSSAS